MADSLGDICDLLPLLLALSVVAVRGRSRPDPVTPGPQNAIKLNQKDAICSAKHGRQGLRVPHA